MHWIEKLLRKRATKEAEVESTGSKSDEGSAAVFFSEIEFSDGTKISLQRKSILVLTGPNNAGKSTALRQLRVKIDEDYLVSQVIKSVVLSVAGSTNDFRKLITENTLAAVQGSSVRIGLREYELKKSAEDYKKSFMGSPVAELLYSYLDAAERLSIASPKRREDNFQRSPREPVQWLDIDGDAEEKVSAAFEKTFGSKLVLNRLAGEYLHLHVTDENIPGDIKANSREHAQWLANLPRLHRQGDGMKTFAGLLLMLLVRPKPLLLIDEPEAFLHPPQIRRLAEAMVDGSISSQIIVATHSDDFVRALLDHSGERVTVARIERVGNRNPTSVLSSAEVVNLWVDPLLRTSDVLSALFHEAAIICEGETDARFFRALLDATKGDGRNPDVRFYHFGGKDRIPSIAKALRAINVPVLVIVDIDVLSSSAKFIQLYESLGGTPDDVKEDLRLIGQSVSARKGQLTPVELAVELQRLADQLKSATTISDKLRNELSNIVRSTNNWQKIKEAGYRALGDASVIQAFERVYQKGKQLGILINREGELEGYCRDISRKDKSEWLALILQRNLYNESALTDARNFAQELRECLEARSRHVL